MTLIKCCQNGWTTKDDTPAVPITPDELARDAAEAVAAGAGALHFHVRDADGNETLEPEPLAAALQAIRQACPSTPVGISTGLWITNDDPELRHQLATSWTVRPDFVSVNLDEDGIVDLAQALRANGVALEAGLSFVEDVERLAASQIRDDLLRILIEPDDESPEAAVERAWCIEKELDEAGITSAPRLHHGYGPATYAVIDAALQKNRDVRIGFEDTIVMRDGSAAKSNAALVAAIRSSVSDA
jgi:uncharacterized protein (DUF849 family)